MMQFKRNLFLFILFCSIFVQAQEGVDCFAEQCSVSESQYVKSLGKMRNLFPTVNFISDWGEEQPQAFATFMTVVVSGGFARKESITLGGFLTVLCHEVGHALHGLSEGAADDYASRVCLKKYFSDEDSVSIVNQYIGLSSNVKKLCEIENQLSSEGSRCARLAVSVFNAATADQSRCLGRLKAYRDEVSMNHEIFVQVPEFYFRCLRSVATVVNMRMNREFLLKAIDESLILLSWPLDFFTKDQRIVSQTYGHHNSPQCRLDTLVAGIFEELPSLCWHAKE